MRFAVIFIASAVLMIVPLFCAVHAQSNTSLGVANYIKIADNNVQDGMIVSTSPKGFVLTSTPYDRFMIGIVSLKAGIVFDIDKKAADDYPVLTTGETYVMVSGANGAIKRGDLITGSSQKGIGIRATQSGYVVGYALEDFQPKQPDDLKKIAIVIKVYPHTVAASLGTNLFDIFNLSTTAATEEPMRVFRYLMAAIVLLISIMLGFVSFGRIASRGIEALGRNPLASRMIQLGIALNVVITIVIIGAGLVIAAFILRL